MRKVIVFVLLGLLFITGFWGCATVEKSSGGVAKLNVKASKYPEIIDHKNMKWGKDAPEWVVKEREEIEKSGKYGDAYLFKFESEKGSELEGSQLWLKNFTVASEISRLVVARINDKVASAVEGNKDLVAAFTKELTTIVSQATINGLKKETDYWVLRRFYNASGEVEGNFYTALILYSVPRSILDDVIKEAIKQANLKTLPKTPEEEDVRSTVIKAFNSGI